GLYPDEIGVEIHVQMRGRERELVREAREGERGVGQDEGPSSANRGPTARHGRQPSRKALGKALVERLWWSGRRGLGKPADRAHRARGSHASDNAVAIDQRSTYDAAGGRL